MRKLVFLFVISVISVAKAQNAKITLYVIDTVGLNTPLTHFKINNKDYISNASSQLIVSLDDPIRLYSKNDTLKIGEYFSIPKLGYTSYKTRNFVNNLLPKIKENNLKKLAPYQYSAYNKFIIYGTKFKNQDRKIEKILEKLKFTIKDSSKIDKHLVLSESMSKRKYVDDLHQLETVEWSKISGLDNPLFFSLNSQLQTINLYNKHLKIIGSKYVNPFHAAASNGYHFYVSDSLQTDSVAWIKLIFYPDKKSRFESVKGFSWINSKDYSIKSVYFEPMYGRKMKKSWAIEYTTFNNTYIPSLISTTINLDNLNSSKLSFQARQSTYISSFRKDNTLHKRQFSDLILDYRTASEEDKETRTTPLTKADSNTYNYFKNKNVNFALNRPLRWGEELYFGKIHTKHLDFHIEDFLDYNPFEGLKTGLGVSSNDLFSSKHEVRAKLAYTWNDLAWKGLLAYKFKVIPKEILSVGLSYENTLNESGGLDQTLYKPAYSTEFIRNFNVSIFDQQFKYTFEVQSKPIKYLSGVFKIEAFRNLSHHLFVTQKDQGNQFREFKIVIRYAYGQQFFRFYKQRLTSKSDYPILWLSLEQSLKNSDYSYTRLLIRTRYEHEFIIYGKTKIEFIAGNYSGELPYFKLFNGLGSSSLKATVHNSFETMGYNEFAASRFAVLFYVHDFGHFNFTLKKTFRPNIQTSFSYGIGALHKIDPLLKTLNSFKKGFAEAGITINDLLLVYPFGVKIGLGASFYHRLFYYRYPTFKQNSILKLTLGFVI